MPEEPISRLIYEALKNKEDQLHPFCEVLVKVQDGRVVWVEITTKHKVANN